MLGSQEKFEPAEAAARQAVKLSPDSARAHGILGFVLMFQSRYCRRRRRNCAKPCGSIRMTRKPSAPGGMRLQQGKLDQATAFWNKAKRLEPTEAAVCAHLGMVYAEQREREKAWRELKEAERLDPEDVNAELVIWQGYEALHETPLALEHLESLSSWRARRAWRPERWTR